MYTFYAYIWMRFFHSEHFEGFTSLSLCLGLGLGLEVFQELFPVACEGYLRPFSASFPFIFVALIHAYLADITQDK